MSIKLQKVVNSVKFKLNISDKRMLELMEWAVANRDDIHNDADYWSKIDFHRNSITKLNKGLQKFTREQIKKACKLTGANANWIFDLEENMFRGEEDQDPIQQLKRVTKTLELKININGGNKPITSAVTKSTKNRPTAKIK